MGNAFQRCTGRVFVVVSFAALLCNPFPGLATPILGTTAQSFAALGYAGVTNAHVADPATHIWGNVGASPAFLSSITGLTSGMVDGTLYGAPSIADTAMAEIGAAATYLKGLSVPSGNDLSLLDLGSRTLTPGVYSSSDSPALLNGTLVLDALSTPNAIFVFKLASALTTGTGSVVRVDHGTPSTQVFWLLGTQANLGSDSTFVGNILAGSSVVFAPTAQILCGRAFAQTGSVTLIDNLISNTCEVSGSGGNDFGSYGYSRGTGDTTQGIPEPGTLTLFSLALGAGFLLLRKFRSTR